MNFIIIRRKNMSLHVHAILCAQIVEVEPSPRQTILLTVLHIHIHHIYYIDNNIKKNIIK